MTGENQLWLLDLLIGVILLGIGWWVNATDKKIDAVDKAAKEREAALHAEIIETRRKVHEQNNEVNKLNVLVAGSYVTREELRDSMREMTAAVTSRIDKLDEKMDDSLGNLYNELKQKADKS